MFGNFPNITGSAGYPASGTPDEYSGALTVDSVSGRYSNANAGGHSMLISLNASLSSAMYSSEVYTVQPRSNQNLIIIKF